MLTSQEIREQKITRTVSEIAATYAIDPGGFDVEFLVEIAYRRGRIDALEERLEVLQSRRGLRGLFR